VNTRAARAAINYYRISKTNAEIKLLVQELVGQRPALPNLRDLVYMVLDDDAPAADALEPRP